MDKLREMHPRSEIGRIVWHDLFTPDVVRARQFYAELLGWKYEIEHANNSVWQSGEADYPLILSGGKAHGGLIEYPQDEMTGWVAYVRVDDVDATAATAKKLGAKVEREPFDTAGVGRSAVIRDLQNALISPHVPTHAFPAPDGTFVLDELFTDDVSAARTFYCTLFGWSADSHATSGHNGYVSFTATDCLYSVSATENQNSRTDLSGWVTYLAVCDLDAAVDRAETLGAIVRFREDSRPYGKQRAVLADPMGAVFGLLSVKQSQLQLAA